MNHVLTALLTPDQTELGLQLFLDAAVKGSAILLIAIMSAYAWRHASASCRHFILATGLASLLALPILSVLLPAWQIAIVDSPAGSTAGGADNYTRSAELVHQTGPASASWMYWIIFVWGVAAVAVMIPTVLSLWQMYGLRKSATTIPQGICNDAWQSVLKKFPSANRIPLLLSEHTKVPMAIGIFKPAILLPAHVVDWPIDRLRKVFLHELAHVLRKDCLTQQLCQFARAMYWPNPLAWIAFRQMVVERERACDDFVVRQGERAGDYADQLVQIATNSSVQRGAALAGVAMARQSQLEGRVRSILNDERRRHALTRSATIVLLCVMMALTGTLAAVQLASDEPEAPDTSNSQPERTEAKITETAKDVPTEGMSNQPPSLGFARSASSSDQPRLGFGGYRANHDATKPTKRQAQQAKYRSRGFGGAGRPPTSQAAGSGNDSPVKDNSNNAVRGFGGFR